MPENTPEQNTPENTSFNLNSSAAGSPSQANPVPEQLTAEQNLTTPVTPDPLAAAPKKKSPILKIIISLLVLGGLGAGGYFGYTYYLGPMYFGASGRIPNELKPYAVGQDADMFMIVKNDDEITALLEKFPDAGPAKDFKAAIIVGKIKSQNAVVAMAFRTADGPTKLRELFDEAMKNNPPPDPSKIKAEIIDNVIVYSYGEGVAGFTGSLLENPGYLSIDKEMADSQVIAYMNNYQTPEASMGAMAASALVGGLMLMQSEQTSYLPPYITAIAHAQSEPESLGTEPESFITGAESPEAPAESLDAAAGTSEQPLEISPTSASITPTYSNPMLTAMTGSFTLVKETHFYLQLKEEELKAKIQADFMGKEEFLASPIAEMLKTSSDKDLSESYDEVIKAFDTAKPDLQKTLDNGLKAVPGIAANFDINANNLTADVTVPQSLAEIGLAQMIEAQQAAPKRARDAERKSRVNDIIVAAEVYSAENNFYPKKSGCIDKLDEITNALKKPPVDPNGAQSFGDITCESGYYYQYIPNNNYVIWAKMESEPNNNTALDPAEFAKKAVEDGKFPKKGSGGKYYVMAEQSGAIESSTGTSGSEEVSSATSDTGTSSPGETSSTPVKRVKRSPSF